MQLRMTNEWEFGSIVSGAQSSMVRYAAESE